MDPAESKKVVPEELLQRLKNKHWHKRGHWYHEVIGSEITEGEMGAWARKLGFAFPKTISVWLSDGDFLDAEEEWVATKQYLLEQYEKDPQYFKTYADLCLREGENLIAFTDSLQKKDFSHLSDQDLGKEYLDLITHIKAYYPFMFSLHLIDEYLTEKFEQLLDEFITNKNLSRVDFFEYQRALTLPLRKIFVLQEKYDLMQLAAEIKDKGLSIEDEYIKEKIATHTYTYAWINGHLFEHEPYTRKHFIYELQMLLATDVSKDYAKMQADEIELRQKQQEYMNDIQEQPELHTISSLIQIYGFLRSFRVDVPCIAFCRPENLVREVARRAGLSWTDGTFLDSSEILDFLKTKKASYKDLITKRRNGFVSIITDNERFEVTDETAAAIERIVALPKVVLTDNVKGQVAYPGKITGPCKVLFNLDDMKKIVTGDILVIAMTDPNYIPAMTKASAFVTDQGGILCHAAIVSREMKKPCIIGTKIATKVFKDGDILEIDADIGVVRKASV